MCQTYIKHKTNSIHLTKLIVGSVSTSVELSNPSPCRKWMGDHYCQVQSHFHKHAQLIAHISERTIKAFFC